MSPAEKKMEMQASLTYAAQGDDPLHHTGITMEGEHPSDTEMSPSSYLSSH